MRAWKKKEKESFRETLNLLGEYLRNLEMNVDWLVKPINQKIWLVKTILMRSQMEMRNMFWTMEENHPCYNAAKNLAELCLCSSVPGR